MDVNKSEDILRLEGKMNKMIDGVMGREGSLVKTASATGSMANSSYKNYRSSFLTLGDMQIPDDYREIFKWCRYFFKFDSLIGASVRSLATFPVTEYILNDSKTAEQDETLEDDSESESFFFYKKQLDDINLYKHLIEIGYDYFLYGNCVIFAEPGYAKVKFRDQNGQIKEKKELVWKSIERLDLTRVRIDRDPATKKSVYYYDIPAAMKQIIRTKKPLDKYNKIPKIFKDAVAKKGVVKLKEEFVYHLSMPSESGDDALWGTPPVLHAMKLILYKNILRQAQEAIAYEHIIPRRIYFFEETPNFAADFNFSQVADDFAFELKKQLNDPNYQVISPVPIQQIQHGGQGRSLLLVPEIEQLDNTILAAMGVPREFVFGGLSYSGSTTSLRILENHFITYRMLIEQYINKFLIKKLAELRGEWEVSEDDEKLPYIEFAELKMQDDIQQKQLMINLNASGKLPDEVLFEKVLGLDSDKVNEMLLNEQKRKITEQTEIQKMQMLQQMELMNYQTEIGMPTAPPEEGGQPAPEGGAPAGAAPAEMPEPSQSPQDAAEQGQTQPGAPEGVNPGAIEQQAISVAQQLMGMSEAERSHAISKLPAVISQRAMMYLHEMKYNEEADSQNQVNMTQMPEKLPPRRAGGV